MPQSLRDAFRPRFKRAVESLYDERPSLVRTTERAVVGRLAIYLDRNFAELANRAYVDGDLRSLDDLDGRQAETTPENPLVWDVEYMRAGMAEKSFIVMDELPKSKTHELPQGEASKPKPSDALPEPSSALKRTTKRKVVPDLIWHRRLLDAMLRRWTRSLTRTLSHSR